MEKKCVLCIRSRVYNNKKNKVTINHSINKCTIKECMSVMKICKPPMVRSVIMGGKKCL